MTRNKDLSWAWLKKIWGDQYKVTPKDIHGLLMKHWLKENYSVTFGHMWKDPENIKEFKKYVQYVYAYMEENKIQWRAALIKLFNKNDEYTGSLLLFLNISTVEDVKTPFKEWKAVTFAKYIGQWRSDFMVKGWLPKDDVKPMIKKVKSLDKKLKKSGLLSKKKKK